MRKIAKAPIAATTPTISKKLIAGFDISTTTIGISFVYLENKTIKEINYFYYKPQKNINQIKMLSKAKAFLMESIDAAETKYGVKPIVCIEDILLYTKCTTYTTIAVLSAINRLMCVAINDKYGSVNLFAVSTIRATLRKGLGLKDRVDKKEVPMVLEGIIKKQIPKFKFEWEIIEAKRKNSKDKILEENFDKADALAVAMTYILKNNEME